MQQAALLPLCELSITSRNHDQPPELAASRHLAARVLRTVHANKVLGMDREKADSL